MCHSLKKVDSQNQKTNANQTFTQTGAYHEKAMDLYFKEGICGTHICNILPISRATKNHGCTHSNILSRKIY